MVLPLLLNYAEIFVLGAFTISFLYFSAHYVANKSEQYYFYFSLACFISAVRIISLNSYDLLGISEKALIIKYINCLSFIWGPYLYILVAGSLFPGLNIKILDKILLYICIAITILIIFVLVPFYPVSFAYHWIIISCILYASYIYFKALKNRMHFAPAMFIANIIFISGIIYDVLYGSFVFNSPVGEINAYTYFIYLYITSIVIAKKHSESEKQRIQSQINFLHAQIKPHFLYNTINTIRACCKTDSEKSQELLGFLSTYLRGKLKDNDQVLTSLMDEVELVKAYLCIEQARFNNRISVEYDIDTDCDVLIPGLIIQPIVENAVKHGLSPKIDGGKIILSIKRNENDNNIIIRVIDNGVGIEKSKLDKIAQNQQMGIGISNTNERLMQYYNMQMNVESKLGFGTVFTITIPTSKVKSNDKMYSC